MGIVYADLRLTNFGRPELEEVDACALVDTGAVELFIPEHIALQLKLQDLTPREVNLADGRRQLVRFVGGIKVEMFGRDCVTSALVMGDQVLLGAVPMHLMDVIIHPRTEQVVPNPESPNVPMFLAKGLRW